MLEQIIMYQLPIPQWDAKPSAYHTLTSESPKTQCSQALGGTMSYLHREQAEQDQPL